MTKKTPKPDTARRRVKEPEARAAFLAMGPARTLQMLQARYQNDSEVAAPNLTTLKRWSSKFGWQDLAAQMDATVTKKVVAAVEARQVKSLARIAEDFIVEADRGLQMAAQLVPESYGEAVTAAARAAKIATVLTGPAAPERPADDTHQSPVGRLNSSIRDRLRVIEASALVNVPPAGSAE